MKTPVQVIACFAPILVRPSNLYLHQFQASKLVLVAAMLSYGKWPKPSLSMAVCVRSVKWASREAGSWRVRIVRVPSSIVLLVMQLLMEVFGKWNTSRILEVVRTTSIRSLRSLVKQIPNFSSSFDPGPSSLPQSSSPFAVFASQQANMFAGLIETFAMSTKDTTTQRCMNQ